MPFEGVGSNGAIASAGARAALRQIVVLPAEGVPTARFSRIVDVLGLNRVNFHVIDPGAALTVQIQFAVASGANGTPEFLPLIAPMMLAPGGPWYYPVPHLIATFVRLSLTAPALTAISPIVVISAGP